MLKQGDILNIGPPGPGLNVLKLHLDNRALLNISTIHGVQFQTNIFNFIDILIQEIRWLGGGGQLICSIPELSLSFVAPVPTCLKRVAGIKFKVDEVNHYINCLCTVLIDYMSKKV